MRRRRFLAATGAAVGSVGLAALPIAAPAAPLRQSRAAAKSRLRVVVVGAGAFGGWTALHLAEMGADVVLVDAYGAGNSRSASGGETRMIRAEYETPLYSRMALQAHARQFAWRPV